MEKIAVNNLVLTLSKMLKGERFIVFRKLKSQRQKLENCKGPEAEKKKLKANRLREQASYLMKVDLKSVALQAFAAEEPWQNALVRSDSTDQERIEARLIGRPRIQEIITEFRSVNPDWKEWVPKLLEEWQERKEKCKGKIRVEVPVVSGVSEEPVTAPATAPKTEVQKLIPKGSKTASSAAKPPLQKKIAPAGSKTTLTDDVKPLIKEEVVPAGANAAPKDTSKLQVMGKILYEGGEIKAEAGKWLSEEGKPSDVQPERLPVQSPGSMQAAVTEAEKAKEAEKELPPRKFAAGDPFFWPSERTGSDDGDEDAGPGRPPFSCPTKQRLPPSHGGPPPRRSFTKSAAPAFKRQHSMAFGPGPDNRRRPQGFRNASLSAGKRPRDTPKDISEDSDLHPSWAAKRRAQKAVVAFQGKKLTFS
ncbi:hypothetical protein V5799_002803 [Amblyomma americanum]|uniref:Serum response factor-binding protein 1 n=2 Tax=Amblyomma americanum TaxID=6943 RepID=A0AAQ4DAS4_AMBAM